MPARIPLFAVLALTSLSLLAFARAADSGPATSAAPKDGALAVTGSYTGEGLTVARGGLARGTVYRGLGEAALEADLAAWGAPAGLTFRASALAPHGGDFSGAKLGDLQGASNIEAYNHPLLFELWFGAKFAGDRAELRLGRLAADSDFATTDGGGTLINSCFGWPTFISANTRNTGPAFYRTATGGYARLSLTESLQVQVGLYDGDSFDDRDGDPSRHPNGLHFEFGNGQGIFALAEISFTPPQNPAAGDRLPTLKLGAWQHTADFADQRDPSRSHSGNRGIYAVAEFPLWREPAAQRDAAPRGLTAFGRFGLSPRQRNPLPQAADAGLSFTGLWRNRPADVFSLGAAWARVSPDARQAERAAGTNPLSDYELVFEMNYTVSVNTRWRIVPDLQWIRHPGGSPALRDALVLGCRTRLEF
jgi:porin